MTYRMLLISLVLLCRFFSIYPKGVIAALPALIHARLHGCVGSCCPEQKHILSKLYAKCQSYLMVVVLTELLVLVVSVGWLVSKQMELGQLYIPLYLA